MILCIAKVGAQEEFSKKKSHKWNIQNFDTEISASSKIFSADFLKVKKNLLTFYVSKETLNRTTFKSSKKGDAVNLEKSLRYGDRISGHFVQGHIDTTCHVKKIFLVGRSWLVNFTLAKKYKKFLVFKGSITINGVSLTIAKILKYGFQIAVIPHTLKLTNLFYLKENDLVNVEFDVLGKYINNVVKWKI